MATRNGSGRDLDSGDGMDNRSNLSSESIPIRGILKTPSFQSNNTKRSIQWDEDKLNQVESLRGTRMKIDEPKTPYVHSFKYDNLTEEERDELEADLDPNDGFELEGADMSSSEGQQDESSEDEWNSDESPNENSAKFRDKSFEAKRAEHYNFLNYVAISRQKLVEDEDEDDKNDCDHNDDEDEDEDEDEDDNLYDGGDEGDGDEGIVEDKDE